MNKNSIADNSAGVNPFKFTAQFHSNFPLVCICVFGRNWRYNSSCFASFFILPLSLCLPRLFETLQSLFWSVFGLLNLYVTNVKARHEFTEFVGATMFGTYNVISLVVLLNMLIAMMNNSYQLIAVSAI